MLCTPTCKLLRQVVLVALLGLSKHSASNSKSLSGRIQSRYVSSTANLRQVRRGLVKILRFGLKYIKNPDNQSEGPKIDVLT
jgi:hypothetical protein